ncbi:hypothetical protein D3C87_1216680 [compost metagenome]
MSSNSAAWDALPLIHAASAGNAVVAWPITVDAPTPSSARWARTSGCPGAIGTPASSAANQSITARRA